MINEINEVQTAVLGVPGRLAKVEQLHGTLFAHQYFTATRPTGRGAETINVCLRFDDFAHNGYQVFSIHGIDLPERRGCSHDEIIAVFPEFAHLVKWHYCTTNGPWGYIESTIYHAGERDYCGLLKGETRQAFSGGATFGIVGEGKARNLDAARRSAVWLDATDEELMQEPEALKAALLARLPKLLAEFRAEMEALGFEWRKAWPAG